MCKLDTAPFRRTPTVTSSAPKQCDFSCMQKQVQDPASLLYVHLARDILAETMKMYPSDSVWVTGHSLGGSLAALASLSITHRAPHTLVPAITFEAPGTRSMAERAGVFPARHQVPEGMHQDAWTGILDAALSALPIYHFGNAGDPVFVGRCNGLASSCRFAGYSMETRCHIGRTCVYAKDRLALNIRHHALGYLLKHFLERTDVDVPECLLETGCTDCLDWAYV
ncbi:MAG: hypothetical protein SGCHY_002512 [Lobulomycetales sp.]